MTFDPECLFCKIITKVVPTSIVHETERTLVIKDINPQAPTHLLVMPKAHYATYVDCDDRGVLADMMSAARAVAFDIGVTESGFRLVINTNKDAGQVVFHIHMHLLAGRELSGQLG